MNGCIDAGTTAAPASGSASVSMFGEDGASAPEVVEFEELAPLLDRRSGKESWGLTFLQTVAFFEKS